MSAVHCINYAYVFSGLVYMTRARDICELQVQYYWVQIDLIYGSSSAVLQNIGKSCIMHCDVMDASNYKRGVMSYITLHVHRAAWFTATYNHSCILFQIPYNI